MDVSGRQFPENKITPERKQEPTKIICSSSEEKIPGNELNDLPPPSPFVSVLHSRVAIPPIRKEKKKIEDPGTDCFNDHLTIMGYCSSPTS